MSFATSFEHQGIPASEGVLMIVVWVWLVWVNGLALCYNFYTVWVGVGLLYSHLVLSFVYGLNQYGRVCLADVTDDGDTLLSFS